MSSDRDIPPALPTLAEIEAMEALLGRATPGPWIGETHAARRRILAPEEATATIAPHSWAHQALFGDVRIRSNVDDRDLAVALRNAAPSLFAAAREAVRLRGELARVRERGA